MGVATALSARFFGSLGAVGRGRWVTIALGSAGAGFVGVVLYRWKKRLREERAKWSSTAIFSSGLAFGVVAMVTGPALRRLGAPRPERVFNSVLPMLRANSEVREVVGARLRPGLFKAHTYSGGLHWRNIIRRRSLSLQPYCLQLLFQVNGEVSSGLVSLQVRNHTPWGRGFLYDSLIIDLPNGERLVLKGSLDQAIVDGYSARLP